MVVSETNVLGIIMVSSDVLLNSIATRRATPLSGSHMYYEQRQQSNLKNITRNGVKFILF